jgi:hypothetical protein
VSVRFEPLVRCDVGDCGVLVEPHILHCSEHTKQRGSHPKGDGIRGHSRPTRPPDPEPLTLSPCCGPFGFMDCPDSARVDRGQGKKRCQRCQARFEREQARPKPPIPQPPSGSGWSESGESVRRRWRSDEHLAIGRTASQSSRLKASIPARTISTFSCDIAYSRSSAASRACPRSR